MDLPMPHLSRNLDLVTLPKNEDFNYVSNKKIGQLKTGRMLYGLVRLLLSLTIDVVVLEYGEHLKKLEIQPVFTVGKDILNSCSGAVVPMTRRVLVIFGRLRWNLNARQLQHQYLKSLIAAFTWRQVSGP